MSRAVMTSLQEWSDAGRRRNRRLACVPWEQRVTMQALTRPKACAPAHRRSRAESVIKMDGYEVRQLIYPDVDWLTDEQRSLVERGPAQPASAAKPGTCPVAACRLIGFDDDSAVCEMTVSGYEVPRAGLPKWLLENKNLKIGDRFFWIMRDANYISADDIDTAVSTAPLRLSDDERRRLHAARAEAARQRELDGGTWEDYTGPGQ